MCNKSGLEFVGRALPEADVRGKSVLEVGAYDVNGSARALILARQPASYLGVDIVPGPSVDELCEAGQLVQRYGENAFDIVFTTEMMEHVRDWRGVISALKGVVRPGGLLVITTRSIGYGYHQWPGDFWRYELDDMRAIFADFEILLVEPDPLSAGVFVKVRKPAQFNEIALDNYPLYSILYRRPVVTLDDRLVPLLSAKERLRTLAGRTRYRLQMALLSRAKKG